MFHPEEVCSPSFTTYAQLDLCLGLNGLNSFYRLEIASPIRNRWNVRCHSYVCINQIQHSLLTFVLSVFSMIFIAFTPPSPGFISLPLCFKLWEMFSLSQKLINIIPFQFLTHYRRCQYQFIFQLIGQCLWW